MTIIWQSSPFWTLSSPIFCILDVVWHASILCFTVYMIPCHVRTMRYLYSMNFFYDDDPCRLCWFSCFWVGGESASIRLVCVAVLIWEGKERMFRPFQVNVGKFLPLEQDVSPMARLVKHRNHWAKEIHLNFHTTTQGEWIVFSSESH